ncbi:MAG TPA: PaaI family thioesterase [Pyrinomonadaceae bacterium]|nr:PaaI family thioesterase [Pyrinomonadaceae bacterium]
MRDFEKKVRDSFSRQHVMELIGAKLQSVESGTVEIVLPFRDDLTQQHGFIHAGIITTIADSACGYAAYTLMPEGTDVLSVEFKTNLLRPARGKEFIAKARVIKPGKTLSVVTCDVFANTANESKIIATMLATMICR